MPTIASGIFKTVSFKDDGGPTTWGQAPGVTTGATTLRRVASNINLSKATYQSGEIRTDQQVADFRHGGRGVAGTVSGELAAGAYQPFTEALLRATGTAVADITGQTVTMAATGAQWLMTVGANPITAGLRVGHVFQITAGTVAAGTQNRNFLITALTSTTAKFIALDGATVTAEAAKTGCTLHIPGKRVFVPSTGHLDKSFYIEEWHSDITLSRQFSGCKITQAAYKLPATGMATVDWSVMGKDLTVGTSQFYNAPSAGTPYGIMAAVNGVVSVAGTAVALITGVDLTVSGGHSVGQVVGSNTTPGVFPGRISVSGQATVYLLDSTFLNYFVNETVVDMNVVLTANSSTSTLPANGDFISIHMGAVKFGGATADDGEKGLILTMPFTAIKSSQTLSSTGFEQTTIEIQDSQFA